jgi:hypothetical protein
VRVVLRITWPVGPRPFIYPSKPVPRTAVLVPWFGGKASPAGTSKTGNRRGAFAAREVRLFPGGWSADVAHFAPEAIAATLPQMRALESVPVPSLTHALIVLRRPEDAWLSENDRDWLWRVFGLPAFEQVIGPRGRLLATECGAHQGVHVEAAGYDLGPVTSAIHLKSCTCGRTTTRIEGVPAVKLRTRAAGAGL